MSYTIKEIFFTLQGEGANVGRAAVFCRFTGCNLWSGREKDRAAAICKFCDTDFVGTDGNLGGHYNTPKELTTAIKQCWPSDRQDAAGPFVVCTGGEPLLQLNEALIIQLHESGFEIAIETNGTLRPPEGIDWICVSPKAETELVLRHGNELKLVYPQCGAEPERYTHLNFQHFFLQPMDGPSIEKNTRSAVEYCLTHPQWRLSLQTQKILGIP